MQYNLDYLRSALTKDLYSSITNLRVHRPKYLMRRLHKKCSFLVKDIQANIEIIALEEVNWKDGENSTLSAHLMHKTNSKSII